MKKADMFIIVSVLIIVTIAFLAVEYSKSSVNTADLTVKVYYDGELYDSASLAENKEITIESELGKNVILITDGGVSMIEADCRDGICIKNGSIDSVGEYIVCLPHKVHVEIVGNEKGDVDAVSQ